MLLDLLAPPACVVCRAPPPRGDVLCRLCRASLPWIRDPCPRCALPRGGEGCPPCPAGRAAFASAWAPVAHAGPARDLVLALKLRGALPAAGLMAAQIAARAPRGMLDGATLVPVPGVSARTRRRGFDPAERIAAAVASRTGLPVAAVLRWSGASGEGRQVGRTRRSRRDALARSATATVPRISVEGAAPERVVLVDDVHTTGATLDACAGVLRSAGSSQVVAVTYGRALART